MKGRYCPECKKKKDIEEYWKNDYYLCDSCWKGIYDEDDELEVIE